MTNQGILIRDVSFVEHPERVKLMPSFERFAATWSKLAAFQLTEFEVSLCFPCRPVLVADTRFPGCSCEACRDGGF